MVFFREMDCRLAILRALNEACEGVVDRNLSWFNQLVRNLTFKDTVDFADNTDTPLTPTLSRWERELVCG